MKKIFVDCSYLYEHKELNTGIQRVVRRVIENLELLAIDNSFEVIPVNISNNQFFRVDINSLYKESKIVQKTDYRTIVKEYFKNIYRALRTLFIAIFPSQKIKSFLFAPTEYFGLNYIIYNIFIKPFKKREATQNITKELEVSKDDILLLLDSTWYLNIWGTIEEVKKKEAKVIAVIYDLIPITNPEFCDDFLAKVFKQWFHDSLNYIDGYITISHTIENDLIKYLTNNSKNRVKDKKFDYFLLGGDFNYKITQDSKVRKNLKNILLSSSTYLIVSTIEPRKNHSYLLDVFDKLWEQNIDVNLFIVGRVGWKVEETIDRINGHKELNKRLYFFNDLNDKELIECYQNSKMLLFPSVVEGFGLPIVESLTHHLPVLASNTPIHKEVGGDNIGYFNIDDSNDLVKQIIDIEKNGIPKKLVPPKDYHWLNWKESTQMLLDKINKISS